MRKMDQEAIDRAVLRNVTEAIRYAKKLVGTPYKYWHPGDKMIVDKGPFWAWNAKAPEPEEVKTDTCACTGVLNLMRRKLGLSVPGVNEELYYAGSTYGWYLYLEEEGRLEKFDINVKYPKGTLLLRNYLSPTDQGHAAVIITEGKSNVLYEKIIQSYSDDFYSETDFSKSGPGITITPTLGMSHFSTPDKEGYYTHVCLPYNWLYLD